MATALHTGLLPLDRTTVERLADGRSEPDWLRRSRLNWSTRASAELWPTGGEEEWRRFPLDQLPTGPLIGPVEHLAGTSWRIEPEATKAGVIFKGLGRACADHPDLLKPLLDDDSGIPSHAAFRAIAGALWSAGSTFLWVPAGVSIKAPLVLEKHWPAGNEAMISRTVVVLGANAEVTLVEDRSSDAGGPGRVAIPWLDVRLGAGSKLRYVGIERLGSDVWDLGVQRYVSERDSDLASLNVLVGSGRTKNGIESAIVGDGATVRLQGLIAAGDDQRIDVNSFQRLSGRGSTSDLLYLSALYDRAKAVYYGVIRVEHGSSGTGSYQECRNMLLSDKASADPIPILEILTNDVARCGHAATAGALDEDELFYVMSRGFDRRAAEQLLVHGFFRRVINQLADEHVRQRVLASLAPRIGQLTEMGGVE